MARMTTGERQSMIIDEAIRIIHNGGYQALSIRELAKKVKISEPAIYRHFLNKEDIIMGILSRMNDFDHLLEKDLAARNTPQKKLQQFMLFHFEFLEKNRELTSILFSEEIFNESEILIKKMKMVIKRKKDILSAIIEEARRQDLLVDIHNNEIIRLILGLVRMICLEWRLGGFDFSIMEHGRNAVKTIEKLIFKN